ncbi:hypothetical protein Pmani_032773 [Petrolisthes manimaculis]|uniref:Uncharacterized protein n=1 Tax=Petrolisthes manimaculis TaxID=1843537 RepID=A0AAE1NSN6_9EUCA|nr:hypothetical protein Pmani_033741 [Petrolisthes manimaculis]KAK4294612.1 hypothetical protein Pmani_032773 [Petrolisthes manimaculis]
MFIAVDLAQSSNVQDAFVIAVEQQARERLERLSALKKIKPVDMTKLSSQLEPQRGQASVGGSGGQASPGRSPTIKERDDVNGVLENSPIYVTSVPSLTSEQPRARSRSRSSTPNRTSVSPRRQPSTRSSRDTPPSPLTPSPRKEGPTLKAESPGADRSSRRSSKRRSSARITNGHQIDKEAEANKSGDELELTHDLNDTLDDTEELDQDEPPDRTDSGEDRLEEGGTLSESGDSLPGTPEKAYGITRHESSRRSSSKRGRREVLLDQDAHKTPVHAVSSVDSRDSTRYVWKCSLSVW